MRSFFLVVTTHKSPLAEMMKYYVLCMSVTCYFCFLTVISIGTVCSHGAVRLVGGNSTVQGRVEVCVNNQWGTVCSNSWSNSDAGIVCRQLGFSFSAGKEKLPFLTVFTAILFQSFIILYIWTMVNKLLHYVRSLTANTIIHISCFHNSVYRRVYAFIF